MLSSVRFRRYLHVGIKRLYGNTVPMIHNSLTNKVEPLQHAERINWYVCGPTVYDDAHLGHARTYICFDVIRRIITSHFNVPLHYAMGVTDIDDKIINRAKSMSVKPEQIAQKYEQRFFDDMTSLGVLEPHARLRVSENIRYIISYIETIIDKGHAYITPSGVYFDVQEFGIESYGCFTNHFEDTREPSVHFAHKRDRRDFSLWKCSSETDLTAGDCWDSPWGIGRPGWHIECSALTHVHFGPHLHIHSGGRDLAFPHHCNEIAQCESHRGEPGKGWGDLWMHTGHLYIQGRKMSKSLKNFISVREVLHQGVHRDDIRIFCLQHHYRADVHYSQDRINEATSLRLSLARFVERASLLGKTSGGWGGEERKLFDFIMQSNKDIHCAFANDFDTPGVLRILQAVVTQADSYISEKESTSEEIHVEPLNSASRLVVDTLCLLGVTSVSREVNNSSSSDNHSIILEQLVKFRSTVRETAKKGLKDNTGFADLLSVCDDLRDNALPSLGIYLEDRPSGSIATSISTSKRKK